VVIQNLYGDVQITAWDRDEVLVEATKHSTDGRHLDDARIVVDSTSGLVSIRTQYTGSDAESPAAVEYRIMVPRNANLENVRNEIRAQQAQLAGAVAHAAYLQREVDRDTNLVKQDVVSTSKLDDMRTELTVAQQQIAQIRANLSGNPDLPYDQQASYKQAVAARDQAALELSYTTVKAPAAGVVTEVDIKPGDMVAAGHPVFALVMSGKRWIEANFKETQLSHVRVGQPVEISVDTYSGRTWHGTVESIAPGTGSVFSVLPAQNATGNWVKVVQRIPVRIAIQTDSNGPDLRAGMSAEANIDTRYSPLFGEADASQGTPQQQ